MADKVIHRLIWETDVGPLIAWGGDDGLVRLSLPNANRDSERSLVTKGRPIEIRDEPHPVLDQAREEVEEYLLGFRTEFEVPLDLRGTKFQMSCWESLLKIPFGRVVTYGRLADQVGRPKSFRAVGGANGANPIPIIVPCHRVVATDGLGGYGGGLALKRLLLGIEGVTEADVRSAGRWREGDRQGSFW